MKIKNLLIFGIVLLLVLQVGFVLAQNEGELTDIGEGLVLEDISVSGIGVEAEAINPNTNKVEFTGIGLGEGESSYVKIGDVEFPNIKSGFMKFGKDGEIKEANFLTDDKETSYWVNENEFIVPANSRFIFDGEKGFILAEGTEVKNVGNSAIISGEDFKLWQGEKQYGASGSLSFDEEGRAYVKADDEFIISNAKILKSNNDVNLYFEKGFDASKHLDENYYFHDETEIALHSTQNGEVNVEYQSGNEFFNMNKREYDKYRNNLLSFQEGDEKEGWIKDEYGYKYKIVPDEKDLLRFSVANGDELKAIERTEKDPLFTGEDKKLIPLIEHNRVEGGETIIQSGRSKFILGDELKLDRKVFSNPEEFLEVYKGKYQSVPFQLKSDSILQGKNYQLRMGSGNQFAFFKSGRKDVRIVYNEDGIGIGNYRETLQTLDQLKAKYPDIMFNLLPKESGDISKEYTEPTPQMIQLLDQWLEEHPEAKLKEFVISDKGGNFNDMFGTIGLDETILYNLYEGNIAVLDRNLGGENTITHEYEHYLDGKIYDEESSKNKKLKSSILNNEEHSLYLEAEEYANKKIENENILTLKDLNFGIDLHSLKKRIEEQLIKEGKNKDFDEDFEWEVNNRLEKILEVDYLSFGIIRGLEQDAGKVWTNCLKENEKKLGRELTLDDYGKIDCSSFFNILGGEAEHLKKINSLVKKEYLKEQYISNKLSKERLVNYYGDIIKKSKENLLQNENFKKTLQNSIDIIERNKNNLGEEPKNRAEIFLALEDQEKISNINILYGLIEHMPELEEETASLIKRVDEEGGLPATYALFETFFGTNDELPSTYREESIAERKRKLHEGTSAQRDVYHKLTQLAFDSGKMNVKEYENLMGQDYCKKVDCCDKKCIIYKLTCEGTC